MRTPLQKTSVPSVYLDPNVADKRGIGGMC